LLNVPLAWCLAPPLLFFGRTFFNLLFSSYSILFVSDLASFYNFHGPDIHYFSKLRRPYLTYHPCVFVYIWWNLAMFARIDFPSWIQLRYLLFFLAGFVPQQWHLLLGHLMFYCDAFCHIAHQMYGGWAK